MKINSYNKGQYFSIDNGDGALKYIDSNGNVLSDILIISTLSIDLLQINCASVSNGDCFECDPYSLLTNDSCCILANDGCFLIRNA